MNIATLLLLSLIPAGLEAAPAPAQDTTPLEAALARAGDNRAQFEQALKGAPEEQREGLRFLIEHMCQGDLETLSAEFLLENLEYAYRAFGAAPWSEAVPAEVFLNDLLPYASINERRDRWRKDFYERFGPLVAEAKTASEAAAILNNEIFPMVEVVYSTERPKADQSPYESIEAGMASCTGLSVLLIDACRAVGVPARFVGTPLWSDGSGNHSWVEVWDGGWRFTGAAEPTGMELDRAWFTGRAAQASTDEPRHGIFAVSYRATPLRFPMVWRPGADSVNAVNVTARYSGASETRPEGALRVRFKAVSGAAGERCKAALTLVAADGSTLFEGLTRDDSFDANDHLTAHLPADTTLEARLLAEGQELRFPLRVELDEQLVEVYVPGARSSTDAEAALAELTTYLAQQQQVVPLASYALAHVPLTQDQAERARALLWKDHVARIREQRAGEMEARELALDGHEMPFWYAVHGEAPPGGRSLWISMHGGGGAPKQVNDQQWHNQKGLYKPAEGVYLAPRAPTDTWNLWHQPHIDHFFDRLIEDLVVFEGVDPDRVYVMGYSAGGDGAYQLGPRMADRWAAVAMMAGHPNESRPDSLRNTAFTLHVGAEDGAYNRNTVAREWERLLSNLREGDPGGYEHWVELHQDKGHWMDREDAAAVPWMAGFTRDVRPEKIVWLQDDVTHSRFYWLASSTPAARSRVVVEREGQEVRVLEAAGVEQLAIRLDDTMVELARPVTVRMGEQILFEGVVPRTLAILQRTLAERGDPAGVWCAEVVVALLEGADDGAEGR